jgi:hypothetical protein
LRHYSNILLMLSVSFFFSSIVNLLCCWLLQIGLRQVAKIMARDPANLQGLAEVFAALQGEQGLVAPLPAALATLSSFDVATAAGAAASAPGVAAVAAATAAAAAVHGAIPLEAIRGLLVDGTYELSEVEVRQGACCSWLFLLNWSCCVTHTTVMLRCCSRNARTQATPVGSISMHVS